MLSLIPHLVLWPALLALVVVVAREVSAAFRQRGSRLVFWQADRERLANLFRCLSIASRNRLSYADTLVHCAADGGPGWYVRDLARAAVRLSGGEGFAVAAAAAPAVFHASDRALLEAAEKDGHLGECFEALSHPRPVSRSLVLPVLLIVAEILACLICNWWMVYGVFEMLGVRVEDLWTPGVPRSFFESWVAAGTDYRTALVFALLGGLVVWLLTRSLHVEAFQRYFFAVSRFLQRSYWLPVLRQVGYSIAVAMRCGMNAQTAVGLGIQGVGNPALRARQSLIVDKLSRGHSVAEAFAEVLTLPPAFFSRLHAIGRSRADADAWMILAADDDSRSSRTIEKWALALILFVYPVWGMIGFLTMTLTRFDHPDHAGQALAIAICIAWLLGLFVLSLMVLMTAIFHTRE